MALLKNVNEVSYAFFCQTRYTNGRQENVTMKKNMIYRNVVNTFVSLNFMKF